MKSLYKTICLTMLMFLMVALVSYASEKGPITKVIEEESLNYAVEKDEVLNVGNRSTTEIDELLNTKTIVKTEKTYKAYKIKPDFRQLYKEYGEFDKLISNDYVWEIPVYNFNEELISVVAIAKGITMEEAKKHLGIFKNEEAKEDYINVIRKVEGKWYFQKLGTDIPPEEINFITDSSNIETLLEEAGLKNPSLIKYVMMPVYATDVLYIKQGNEEYGIPFSYRTDLTGLENRKVYKMSDIITSLEKVFPKHEEGTFGGGSKSSTGNTSKITIGSILAVLCIVTLIIVRSRKLSTR